MKPIITTGKRKSAIAKALISPGTGLIRINSKLLDVHEPKMIRMKVMEPLILAENHSGNVDISINVRGGGIMSQAEASRLAIAKALVEFTKDKKLEKEFLDYDRHLLVADIRRKEAKKPNRHGKARAKVQKSYR